METIIYLLFSTPLLQRLLGCLHYMETNGDKRRQLLLRQGIQLYRFIIDAVSQFQHSVCHHVV
jgi:hypothetical protein